ncbi:hypothetical protein [Celeribacter indicus]|uniref:Uncharacterized protein n=1 Tax=Celeribacter indicus TaxID=1208324 RepID=A0A0B5E2M8_9RHOB|nr:hypothetical protein [Celeribacter indicus]AJE47281.1 hypothetical protein P73_2566 [Celeribacter indicus]SDW02369.1 hypothetical protein SAMN05443573_101120 [Celeribacter indicus]
MGSIRQNGFGAIVALRQARDQSGEGMVLVVGEPQRMHVLRRHFPGRSGMFFIEFQDLTPEAFAALQPACVVSQVMSAEFDCLDLGAFLDGLSYRGAFRVLAQDLPRPEIVRQEARARFPRLNFDVIETGAERPASPRPRVPLH